MNRSRDSADGIADDPKRKDFSYLQVVQISYVSYSASYQMGTWSKAAVA
jgi:hypothetical protein